MNAFEQLDRHQPLFAEARGDIQVSFEFFPPKTDTMAETLWTSIQTLAPLRPRFVSVTYGAGGSTRERTHATVERILKETALTPAAHLTCVGASRDEVDAVARDYWELGVRHIVALRGDASEPGARFEPHPDGYANAAELVAGLKQVAPFDISVAAYPEIHPDSTDRSADLNRFAWWCFENKVNLDEAYSMAEKGTQLAKPGKDRAAILDTMAEICNAKDDCPNAIKLTQSAIKEDPKNPHYQEQLKRFQDLAAKQVGGTKQGGK